MVHALDLLGTFAFALSGALLAAGSARTSSASSCSNSEIYATPAALASLIVAVVSRSAAVEIAAAVLATAIRLASLRYRWSAPRPRL